MSMEIRTWVSPGPDATRRFGEFLGQRLSSGSFLALVGDLGAGKTHLSQGILSGLGVEEPGGSPTFTLLWEYPGRLAVYHWDLYRLGDLSELDELGYEESFYGQGACLVEWADLADALWPERYLRIELQTAPELDLAHERRLVLTAVGDPYVNLLKELDDAGFGD